MIKLKAEISQKKILNALGLITSFSANRFQIESMPKKFDIPNADESIVRNILG
jgi:hypothetical protein